MLSIVVIDVFYVYSIDDGITVQLFDTIVAEFKVT